MASLCSSMMGAKIGHYPHPLLQSALEISLANEVGENKKKPILKNVKHVFFGFPLFCFSPQRHPSRGGWGAWRLPPHLLPRLRAVSSNCAPKRKRTRSRAAQRTRSGGRWHTTPRPSPSSTLNNNNNNNKEEEEEEEEMEVEKR